VLFKNWHKVSLFELIFLFFTLNFYPLIDKAVILAGGLGTRLKGLLGEIPKPMAPINKLPFLHYLLNYLSNQGVKEVFLCVGFQHEVIVRYFGDHFRDIKIFYTIEKELLGTGGAIMPVLSKWREPFFLLNGDTFFEADLKSFSETFFKLRPLASLSLKPVFNQDRYGAVQLQGDKITSFTEKKFLASGLINAGVSILTPEIFEGKLPGDVFSYEKDLFEKKAASHFLHGFVQDEYFIDIGIPEDYERAQKEIPMRFFIKTHSAKFLFLDRDGVINKHLPGDYVKNIAQFEFLPGVLDAIIKFNHFFSRIVIVTNQQGIGKNLYSEKDLNEVHQFMTTKIKEAGGTIDAIYFCPSLEIENPICRKPNVGMGLQAKRDFPDIDFKQSVMIGDSMSDMQFGRNLGMFTILISSDADKKFNPDLVDLRMDGLKEVADLLT
jgi:D-glycero-alpha-D-manno-heptose 1-phosphate guanylyltransferase